MEKILIFLIAFAFVAIGVMLLMGKADFMLNKYRLAFREGKLRNVKIREYDKKARPVVAILFFLVAVLIVLLYLFPSISDKLAIVVVAVLIPFVLLLELKYRKK